MDVETALHLLGNMPRIHEALHHSARLALAERDRVAALNTVNGDGQPPPIWTLIEHAKENAQRVDEGLREATRLGPAT